MQLFGESGVTDAIDDAQWLNFQLLRIIDCIDDSWPFFHIDVPAAVESAISGIEQKLAHVSTDSSERNIGQTELSTKQA